MTPNVIAVQVRNGNMRLDQTAALFKRHGMPKVDITAVPVVLSSSQYNVCMFHIDLVASGGKSFVFALTVSFSLVKLTMALSRSSRPQPRTSRKGSTQFRRRKLRSRNFRASRV